MPSSQEVRKEQVKFLKTHPIVEFKYRSRLTIMVYVWTTRYEMLLTRESCWIYEKFSVVPLILMKNILSWDGSDLLVKFPL